MKSRIGKWFWYKHPVWGWLEVFVLGYDNKQTNHLRCFSAPCIVYTLLPGQLKLKPGRGKIYEGTPNELLKGTIANENDP